MGMGAMAQLLPPPLYSQRASSSKAGPLPSGGGKPLMPPLARQTSQGSYAYASQRPTPDADGGAPLMMRRTGSHSGVASSPSAAGSKPPTAPNNRYSTGGGGGGGGSFGSVSGMRSRPLSGIPIAASSRGGTASIATDVYTHQPNPDGSPTVGGSMSRPPRRSLSLDSAAASQAGTPLASAAAAASQHFRASHEAGVGAERSSIASSSAAAHRASVPRAGEDTLDFEMRNGLGASVSSSRPGSRAGLGSARRGSHGGGPAASVDHSGAFQRSGGHDAYDSLPHSPGGEDLSQFQIPRAHALGGGGSRLSSAASSHVGTFRAEGPPIANSMNLTAGGLRGPDSRPASRP